QTRPASPNERLLAAALAGVHRIPRRARTTGPVVMADLRLARVFARPVVAGVIGVVRVRTAGRLGAGEDVVLVRRLAEALDGFALFRERGCTREGVSQAGELQRVTVQMFEVPRDRSPPPVVPWALPQAVARVGRVGARGAEIRVPGTSSGPGRRRQRLAVRVSARNPAQVPAFADGGARDEERHRRRGALGARPPGV